MVIFVLDLLRSCSSPAFYAVSVEVFTHTQPPNNDIVAYFVFLRDRVAGDCPSLCESVVSGYGFYPCG